jgi:hypothetical protein
MTHPKDYQDRPTLKHYIKQTIDEFVEEHPKEASDFAWHEIDFDIGVVPLDGRILVDDRSTNRIKFTLKVKRG